MTFVTNRKHLHTFFVCLQAFPSDAYISVHFQKIVRQGARTIGPLNQFLIWGLENQVAVLVTFLLSLFSGWLLYLFLSLLLALDQQNLTVVHNQSSCLLKRTELYLQLDPCPNVQDLPFNTNCTNRCFCTTQYHTVLRSEFVYLQNLHHLFPALHRATPLSLQLVTELSSSTFIGPWICLPQSFVVNFARHVTTPFPFVWFLLLFHL